MVLTTHNIADTRPAVKYERCQQCGRSAPFDEMVLRNKLILCRACAHVPETPQDILSPAAKAAGYWLGFEEDFVYLKIGDVTLASFTHHASDEAIRTYADMILGLGGRTLL